MWQSLQTRRRVIAAGILLAGCAIGLAVYLTAPPPDANPLEESYASKQYERQIETVGGKGALVATEFQDWFASLWHGKRLGLTIACVSALLALGVFVALTPLTEGIDPGDEGRGPA